MFFEFINYAYIIILVEVCQVEKLQMTIQDVKAEYETASPYEWAISFQESLREIIDLNVGESMNFQPNRDNDKSRGIILRTK